MALRQSRNWSRAARSIESSPLIPRVPNGFGCQLSAYQMTVFSGRVPRVVPLFLPKWIRTAFHPSPACVLTGRSGLAAAGRAAVVVAGAAERS